MIRVSWQEGVWTTPPASFKVEGGCLTVEAVKGSDYWQKTMYGFQHNNGHALLTIWNPGTAMEVTFQPENFTELYDQAGIMLWHSLTQWLKTGIEVNDGILHISAVSTNEYSDWSLFPIPEEWLGKELTLRASIYKDAAIIRARAHDSRWVTIRVARFPYESGNKAGPFLCSPTREGFQVKFTSWVLNNPDVDIHTDPPI